MATEQSTDGERSGPALLPDLLEGGTVGTSRTVCLRAGLERPLLLPKVGRDEGAFPQGTRGVAELQPHLPFLTTRPTQASVSPDEETAAQKAHGPVQGHTESVGGPRLNLGIWNASPGWLLDRGGDWNSKLTKQIGLGYRRGAWGG